MAKRSSKKEQPTPAAATAGDTGAPATEATDAAAAPAAPAPAAQALGEPVIAADGAILLQAWTPLGRSLDSRIGRAAWPTWAAKLFADEAVPHIAHDSGTLSARNGRVIAAWLDEAEAAGTLPETVVLVEAGIGTGLHLRYLLRALVAHAEANGAAWLSRLQVWATDVSRDLLVQARDRGLFTSSIDVRYALLDVVRPSVVLPLDAAGRVLPERDLAGTIAVWIANYVLDLMPADMFRRVRQADGGVVWQAVLAQTWLGAPQELDRFVDLGVDEVRALAAEGSALAMARLADIWSLLEVEIRAYDLDADVIPDAALHGAVADAIEAALGRDHAALADGTLVHHSGGALVVLERVGAALLPGGIALVRDLGGATAEEVAVPRGAAHYGPTIATGLSLFELDIAFADGRAGCALVRPAHDGPRAQASRLLVRGGAAAAPGAVRAFVAALDGATIASAEAQVQAARDAADPTAAIEGFRAALKQDPANWHLLYEAGRVALERAGNAQLAAFLAREGLRINASTSGELWCLLADAVWALGDRRTARAAYGEALRIRPRDARAHYGAAYVDAERGRFDSALEHIGQALAHDPDGRLRAEVLQLLDVCLRGQAVARSEDAARIAKRTDR